MGVPKILQINVLGTHPKCNASIRGTSRTDYCITGSKEVQMCYAAGGDIEECIPASQNTGGVISSIPDWELRDSVPRYETAMSRPLDCQNSQSEHRFFPISKDQAMDFHNV